MKILKSLLIFTLVVATFTPLAAVAATSPVREAQTIMTKFALPTGPIDGDFGPLTARGACAFRQLAGSSASRSKIDSGTLSKLRSYNKKYSSLSKIPAPKKNGKSTYLLVQQKCQVMFYVENGYYQRVMPVSTGMSGHRTPNGTYDMGYTEKGWHCSTFYPESCSTQSTGRFKGVSNYGNMYNQRFFKSGGYYVHGSTSVPTYPASHGCIRVTIKDSDWMYDHVGNSGTTPLMVTGSY